MSELVKITLPDGSQKEAARGITVLDFVKLHIGAGLAKAAYVAKLDGQPVDLARTIEADARLEVVTTKNPEALEVARHDAAHVMASVVQQLFPGTQVTIGPSIEDGFYYDFARDKPFTPEDLEKIEAATNEAIKADHPFLREEVSMEQALALFEGQGEKYKVEIIRDIAAKGAKTLTLYRHGGWVDFCLGPHGPSTSPHRRRQAHLGGRRLLAGRLEERHAAAHLRHRLLRQEGAGRPPPQAGGGEEARPPQARPRARALRLPRVRPRRPLLAAGRHHALQRPAGRHAPPRQQERLPGGQDAAALQQAALGAERPLGAVQEEHVPGGRQRVGRDPAPRRALQLLAQAHELPVAPPHLQDGAAQLPRAAAPLLHHRRPAPERGLRVAGRPDPGAPVRAGRLAHLPDGVADRRPRCCASSS